MKKFIYVAIMALVMGMFAGCKSGINGSDYYAGGRTLDINPEKSTVNGYKYDNVKEKCWMWTLTEKTQGTTLTFDYYVWCTEFELVASCETEMYECSRSGREASYAYIQTPARDTEEKCERGNN